MQGIRDALRARYRECVIVFIPEQNLGKEASHLDKYIRGYRVITMREGANKRWAGVRKTDTVTVNMHKQMVSMLGSNTLSIAEDCIGIPTIPAQKKHGLRPGTPEARAYMLNELRKQFRSYRWEETTSRKRHDFVESAFKLTGKRSNMNDDLLICANTIVYWRNVFWQSDDPEYQKAKEWMGMSSGLSLQPSISSSTSTISNLALVRNPQ